MRWAGAVIVSPLCSADWMSPPAPIAIHRGMAPCGPTACSGVTLIVQKIESITISAPKHALESQ
jgi:hypothetical protein